MRRAGGFGRGKNTGDAEIMEGVGNVRNVESVGSVGGAIEEKNVNN